MPGRRRPEGRRPMGRQVPQHRCPGISEAAKNAGANALDAVEQLKHGGDAEQRDADFEERARSDVNAATSGLGKSTKTAAAQVMNTRRRAARSSPRRAAPGGVARPDRVTDAHGACRGDPSGTMNVTRQGSARSGAPRAPPGAAARRARTRPRTRPLRASTAAPREAEHDEPPHPLGVDAERRLEQSRRRAALALDDDDQQEARHDDAREDRRPRRRRRRRARARRTGRRSGSS